jgi:hypothetical protein
VGVPGVGEGVTGVGDGVTGVDVGEGASGLRTIGKYASGVKPPCALDDWGYWLVNRAIRIKTDRNAPITNRPELFFFILTSSHENFSAEARFFRE